MSRLSRRLFLKHLLAGIVSNRWTSFVFWKKKKGKFLFHLYSDVLLWFWIQPALHWTHCRLSVCVTTLFYFYEPTRTPGLLFSTASNRDPDFVLWFKFPKKKNNSCRNKWKERLLKLVVVVTCVVARPSGSMTMWCRTWKRLPWAGHVNCGFGNSRHPPSYRTCFFIWKRCYWT